MQNRVRHCLLGTATLALTALAAAGPTGLTADDLQEINGIMGLASSELVQVNAPFTAGERIVTSFRVGEGRWTLDLTPRSVRAENYRIWYSDADGNLTPIEPGPINTYRGTILEHPDARVIASVLEGGLVLQVRFDDGAFLWMEPVGNRVAGATDQDYVLYDNAAIIPSGAACGLNEATLARRHEHVADNAHTVIADGEEEGNGDPAAFGSQTYYAEIACDADFPYFQDYGSNTEGRINSVINGVNGQYEQDVDISHFITEIIVRTSSVYSTNDAFSLLTQFRNRWLSQHQDVQRDVAHLFTGRNLQGGTIGIAYDIGAICTNNAYCLSESDCCGSFGCATDLTAHELGHLWNGSHCSCQNPDFTMNPFILCANNFSTATRNSIIGHRNSRSCLDLNPPLQSGACCLPTGACDLTSAPNCSDQGGLYLGDGSNCTSGNCPEPTGACCLVDGTCLETESGLCQIAGGTYEGNGSSCAIVNCPQPLNGGCCFTDGTCGIVFDFECDQAGGFFLGNGSNCAGVNCPTPTGACCLTDGTCFSAEAAICSVAGGSYSGDGTDCAGVTCETKTTCAADVDGDSNVGFNDLVSLLSSWGPCAGCPADVDGNDTVDFNDLVTVLSAWGPCP